MVTPCMLDNTGGNELELFLVMRCIYREQVQNSYHTASQKQDLLSVCIHRICSLHGRTTVASCVTTKFRRLQTEKHRKMNKHPGHATKPTHLIKTLHR